MTNIQILDGKKEAPCSIFFSDKNTQLFVSPNTTKLKSIQTNKKDNAVRFLCDQCNFSSTRRNDLKRHKESKHEGVRYKCTQCAFSGSRAAMLRKHIQSRHGENLENKSYRCDICPNSFETALQLIAHKKTWHKKHTSLSEVESKHREVRYHCDICKYSALSPLFLSNHKKSQHGIFPMKYELVIYPCDNCDYSPTTLEQLRKHKLDCKDKPGVWNLKDEVDELDPLAGL